MWKIFCSVLILVLLGLLCLWAYLQTNVVAEATYIWCRHVALACAMLLAAVAVFRISTNVAIPRTIPNEFVPELMGYMIFWVLVPPIWFFFEYLAYDSRWIVFAGDRTAKLDQVKTYSDFASKIWAAVIAALVGLVALKK